MSPVVVYFYRPQTKFAKVMFLQVSFCPRGGGMHGSRGCVWLPGGHAWLPGGHAWFQVGACVVGRGHVWLPRGACVAARGACMVAGGLHDCWGACMVAGGACIGYDEIRSMSGRYASYWNAFLLHVWLSFCYLFDRCLSATLRKHPINMPQFEHKYSRTSIWQPTTTEK